MKQKKTKKKTIKTCKHKDIGYKYWYTPNGNDYEALECENCGIIIKERGPYEASWSEYEKK